MDLICGNRVAKTCRRTVKQFEERRGCFQRRHHPLQNDDADELRLMMVKKCGVTCLAVCGTISESVSFSMVSSWFWTLGNQQPFSSVLICSSQYLLTSIYHKMSQSSRPLPYRPSTRPGTTSATQTQTEVPTLRLRATSDTRRANPRPRIQWADDVIDNEGMGRKKSKGRLPRVHHLS